MSLQDNLNVNVDMANTINLNQIQFNLSDAKKVSSDHEIDKYIKINLPVNPVVFIENDNENPIFTNITMTNANTGVGDQDYTFEVKQIGVVLKLINTYPIYQPTELVKVLKKSGFTNSTKVTGKSKSGINVGCKFARVKYNTSTQYEVDTTTTEETDITWTQYLSVGTYYLHQSVLIHSFKISSNQGQDSLVKQNPEYDWRKAGDGNYCFFTSSYRNDYVLRKFDTKYQLIDENDFIDYVVDNKIV